MAATGETLRTPGGTSFSIVESAADSGGKRIEFQVTMPPGAPAPPKHFHPRQEESWRVLDGELSILVEKEWRTLGAGDSLSLPANTVPTAAFGRNQTGLRGIEP